VTHEQEEQVRRALAATPPEAPMPPEVVARLDATLAELVAHRPATSQGEGAEGPAPAEVAELEQRRRRWPKVLVAAASVSVLAYGVGTVFNDMSGADGEATSADSGSTYSEAGGQSEDRAAGPDAPEAEPLPAEEAPGELTSGLRDEAYRLLAEEPVRLRTETLRRDVARLVGRVQATDDARKARALRDTAAAQALARCAAPALGKGDDLAAVRLDGTRASLVVRAPSGGTRVAEVYSCDDAGRLLAVTEVPTRR
jgi:hypothetical protein